MSILKHTVYRLFGITLLGMVCLHPAFATVITSLPTQYIEKKLPQQRQSVEHESQIDISKSRFSQEEQQSVLRHNRISLNKENIRIQNMLDQMIQNPNDIVVLQKLIQTPEKLLHQNITGKLYETKSVQNQRVLIKLLPLISGEKALPLMMSWVDQFQHNSYIVQAVIAALYYMPESDKSRDFINQLLDNERQDSKVIKSALFYHAARPGEMSRRWANQYRSPGTHADLRYAGLYLAAVLGDKSIVNWIIEELDKNPLQYKRYYLQLALSMLVDKKKFEHFSQRFSLSPANAESIQRQLFFKQATEDQKIALLGKMLDSGYFQEKQLALNYLIETQNYQYLTTLLQSQFASEVYRRVQYAGINLELINDQSPQLDAVITSEKFASYMKIVLVILASLILIAIVWFLIKRQKIDTKPIKLEEKA